MGVYRLFLAFCVLYSHTFGSVMGWNIGVVAVISFFVMSGYVMETLISKYYPDLVDIPAFYKDRAARLFPQYLFYLMITLFCVNMIGLSDPFLAETGPTYILLNIMILPLGFYMFGLEQALYVPPAWSLGLEFCFYLIFPLFWQLNFTWKYAYIGVSFAVACAALVGIINTDWFGYRLLPGTFFIFIAGATLARPDSLGRYYPVIVWTLGLIAFICTLIIPHFYALSFNREVMAGVVIGITGGGTIGEKTVFVL